MTILTRREKFVVIVLAIALLYAGLLIAGGPVANAYQTAPCCGGKEVKFSTPQIRWDGDFQDSQSYLGVFPSETRQDLRNSAMQWDDAVTGASLNVDENVTQHDAWWTGISFSNSGLPDVPGTTVVDKDSTTGYVNWAVSYLNSDWSWNRNCDLDGAGHKADARVISAHEDGHWLVLNHDSNHQEAVMWPDYTCKLQTVADDKNGARHLYP